MPEPAYDKKPASTTKRPSDSHSAAPLPKTPTAPGKKPVIDARGASDQVGRGGEDGQLAPGKHPLPQGPSPAGNPYIDQGSYKGPDSFLTDPQRERLVYAFQLRAVSAESNYQDAAGDVRVDKLLAKEDTDLPWIASLMIDLALGFVVGQIATSLISFRDVQSGKVKKLFDAAIMHQEPDPKLNIRQRLQAAAGKLKDDHVKTAVGTASALGKKQALARLAASRGAEGASKKQDSLLYLNQLRDAASLAYQQFREFTPTTATDTELLLLFDSMDGENHLISQYKLAIEDKLKRFEDSKVTKIGRRFEYHDSFDDEGRQVHGGERRVVRDVWVQWQTYESGYPPDLVFRYQDGRNNPSVIRDDDPGRAKLPMERKVRNPIDEPENGISNDPKAIYIVPLEFREIAIARHRQMWSAEPETVRIDDESYQSWDPVRAQEAREHKEAKVPKVQIGTPASTNDVPKEPPKGPVVVPDVFRDVDTQTGKKKAP